MHVSDLKEHIPESILQSFQDDGISELRPAQEKAINAGLLDKKSLLICTPTASGKTLIAEFALINTKKEHKKTIYIVPLKALAREKYNHFKKRYPDYRCALAVGDEDADGFLSRADILIVTAEKFDSLLRHHVPWLHEIGTVVVDEIHLLNDSHRGPTLEVILTILKRVLKGVQIIGLSATIGNPKELAQWLNAELVQDSWRPVPLHKGVYFNGEVKFDSD